MRCKVTSTMSSEFDILVIGATGYTGQLVIDYLAHHARAPDLRIALGGRTIQKVQQLAQKYINVASVHVDVDDEPSVVAAVAKTRVVINIAGPYYTRGSVVVKACARKGVHYVDLTGEAPWVAQIIDQYDYLAYKTGACIVPCSGYDSIPSDITAHVGLGALEKQLGGTKPSHITSTTAHVFKGGMSGGTAASLFSAFEDIPSEQRRRGSGWGLSPIPPPPGFSALPGILYSLPRVTPRIWGGYFIMSSVNSAIVRRSWGLKHRTTPAPQRPTFSYDEFITLGGPFKGVLLSLTVLFTALGFALFPPFRWLAKKVLPQSGQGPAPEKLDKGLFRVVNVVEAGDVAVKTVFEGDGDPGYRLTSIMIVESALLLLDPANLSEQGRQGGILTPSVAYGDALVKVLEATGRFKMGVEVLEDRKTR
ncbi:saccharopine dehydrogenase [Rhizoctonia solani AG-3 Rhs1AP]|uniref:Saccharopine dehydrogenase n=2 Tax=Rhizoctonia solani AG-3 TaxID=1086053 RepID=A0A074RPW1_9AGAM|nr:saccharopine dehydrogenase [Rhizoctonia solani AG-3 Rhs1AP]KEP48904.1 saccharopine dehydrogenase [Rhizoctonia solani 123E]